MHITYLGLGSNLGNRRELLDEAIKRIDKSIGTVVRQSTYYETEPWGFDSENLFLNAAICVETELTPRQLLQATQYIERQLGRTHKTPQQPKDIHANPSRSEGPSKRLNDQSPKRPKYSDRPIDIDILLYDDITIDEPDLKIPHPLMNERDFVIVPLREIMQ